MSDTILKLIPINSTFIPNKENQSKACLFLCNAIDGQNVEINQTEDVEFIDQGNNFDSISCNYCGKDIDMEIWQAAMDTAYESRFIDLTFNTPCCAKTTTLNDLQYQMPAGFAKFSLSISNPKNDIKETELNELEKILETRLRKIWAHY